MKRHDLVYLSRSGMECAIQEACKNHPDLSEKWIREIIAGEGIPGIIKRQEKQDEKYMQVGISTWQYSSCGSRIRLNSMVPKADITKVITPFEVLRDYSIEMVYQEVRREAIECGIEVGIYGSSALQEVTGQPYRNEGSDIDLLIKSTRSYASFREMMRRLDKIEGKYGTRFDIEVEYREIYGIKLKELLSEQKTVLAKGLYDVQLLERAEVLGKI